MIKLVALVRRKSDLSKEAFVDYWVNVHAPLAAAIPGMRGYRINIAGDAGDMPAAAYDGSAEIWFDSREAMQAGLASPENDIAAKDTENFLDHLEFLVTDEQIILPKDAA
jgi:uncharacterized protein (TIGR02118 family)